MASLFADIDEFKAALGGGSNVSVNMESVAPYIDIAFQRHVEDWTGPAIYASLVTAHASGNPLSSANSALLPYFRNTLVFLAYLEYSAYADIQWSESGRYRIENDQYKTLYKYQVNGVDRKNIINGYEALERLILFLEKEKATYTGWPDAPGYQRHHGVLLNTAAAWRSAASKKLYRNVFEVMRSTIEDVEAFVLVPLMGEEQYQSLLDHRKAGTWTTADKEQELIYRCNKATSHFVLAHALVENWVKLEGDMVVQVEFLEDHGKAKEGTASSLALGVKRMQHDDTANRHINRIQSYLDANIGDPAFAEYKAHKAELDEAAETEAATNTLPGDAAVSAGWDPTAGRKGIIRF